MSCGRAMASLVDNKRGKNSIHLFLIMSIYTSNDEHNQRTHRFTLTANKKKIIHFRHSFRRSHFQTSMQNT